jgi:RES domain-containing protein
MEVYRFSNTTYASDLSGTGAKLFGGRWNHKGLAGLYTSSAISLALLEILVNAITLEQLNSLALLKLKIPTDLENSVKELGTLKTDWDADTEYTRYIGSEFLQNRSFLMLRCPSAVVNEEWNYLINPLHEQYDKLTVASVTEYQFDKRLFKVTTY